MAADPRSEGLTTRQIARMLRRHRDNVAELEALDQGPAAPSCTDYSKPVVMGGGGGAGPADRYVERRQALAASIALVDGWLAMLSPLERKAAEFWLADQDGTIGAVALETGLEYERARQLVKIIPLLIWGRCYHKETP